MVVFDGCVGIAVLRSGVVFIAALLVAVRRTDSSRRGTQTTDAQQVIGGAGEVGQLLGTCDALDAGLAQTVHGLHPAEDFLDPFAFALTHPVAVVPGGVIVETGGLAVLRSGQRAG